jgi:hypothetical protein
LFKAGSVLTLSYNLIRCFGLCIWFQKFLKEKRIFNQTGKIDSGEVYNQEVGEIVRSFSLA